MHIVLVSPSWPLGVPNGIVTYVHHLRVGLRALGHHVSVLAVWSAKDIAKDDIYQVAPSLSTKFQWRTRRLLGRRVSDSDRTSQAIVDSVMRLHARHAVDLVEIEETFGWCAEVQLRLPMPVVVKLHGPAFLSLVEEELQLPASVARIAAEHKALKQARYVTSPSRGTLERTRAHCGRPSSWGGVLPNPIVMASDVPQWSLARADAQTLLFVGRFDKVKGGDLVVLAFARMLVQRPSLRLLFAGPDYGVQLANGQRCSLEEFVKQEIPAEHQSQVEILGKLPQDKIAQLRCQAALVLVSSRWDNFPNTALEASLQGCPIVGFDVGGLSEIVQHGVTGLLARPGDIDEIVRHTLWLLDHPQDAAAFGAAARQHVKQANGLENSARLAADHYRWACDDFAKLGLSR